MTECCALDASHASRTNTPSRVSNSHTQHYTVSYCCSTGTCVVKQSNTRLLKCHDGELRSVLGKSIGGETLG